jgi:integrase
MTINRLSDRRVQTAKCPEGKPAIMLNDGGGLMLRVAATGGKSWIFRYMRNGRSHDAGLGPLHTISLAEAREAALQCRKLRLAGKDPLLTRRAERQREVLNFEDFAEEYIEKQEPGWAGKRTAEEWRNTLRQHIHPRLGSLPLNEIDTQAVLRAIEPLWAKRTEQGRRVLNRIETVLDAAAAAGHRSPEVPNPARWPGHMEHLLSAPPAAPDKHHEAMPYSDVPEFLHSLEGQSLASARALRMLVLTAVRTGELIKATWEEFDLDNRVWTIPGERMKRKNRGDFRVPLSDAALAVLREIPRASAGPFQIGNTTMYRLMERCGLSAKPHGFRSSFKDWATEQTEFAEEIAEACLAHFPNDKTVAAYQRGDRLEQRRRLMEAWGRYCGGAGPAEVVPLRAQG